MPVLALTAFLSAFANAQSSQPQLLRVTNSDPNSEYQARLNDLQSQAGVPLEGAVNPEEYIVGPGDVFQVSIGGLDLAEIHFAVTVSVSGQLMLPEVGGVAAAGRSLAEVETDAIHALRKHYANVPISLALVKPRSFYVHVSGAVPQPGRYVMLPIARVSDVIQRAYASELVTASDRGEDVQVVTPPSPVRPVANEDYSPALRNVLIVREDGSSTLADLTRYQTTGNPAHNPYLHDGDRIIVPAHNFERDGVRVSGDVAWPGFYDLRPDDTIQTLLDLAAGGIQLDSLARVRLIRIRMGNVPEVIEIDLASVYRGKTGALALQAKDHISVYKIESATATIEGRVAFPDTYQIESGVTTLRELVDLSGGLLSDANVRTAILERTGAEELSEVSGSSEFFEEDDPENSVTVPFDFFRRGFTHPYSGPRGSRVAVDMAGALSGQGPRVVLYDGDRVIFPRDEGTVFVTGHVSQPGYVAIQAGATAEYYVARAGGAGPGSTEIYVYEGSSGQVRAGAGQIIRSGDAIFVDRMEQVVVQMRQSRAQLANAIFSAAATITGIALTVINLLSQ